MNKKYSKDRREKWVLDSNISDKEFKDGLKGVVYKGRSVYQKGSDREPFTCLRCKKNLQNTHHLSHPVFGEVTVGYKCFQLLTETDEGQLILADRLFLGYSKMNKRKWYDKVSKSGKKFEQINIDGTNIRIYKDNGLIQITESNGSRLDWDNSTWIKSNKNIKIKKWLAWIAYNGIIADTEVLKQVARNFYTDVMKGKFIAAIDIYKLSAGGGETKGEKSQ
ncbi:hypothetical protein N9562_00325 [Flavobacteriaceae bacterium]|nr:hypothetical protein [Flavobacteriaceae bacterium]